MKKFFFFVALVLLIGCQRQKSVNSAGTIRETRFAGASEEQTEPVEAAKAEEADKSEPRAKPDPRRADARREDKAEPEPEEASPRPRAERPRLNAEQGERSAEPRAEPRPKPRRAEPRAEAEPVTPTIPMGPSGARGVVLRNPRTVTYRPAYAAWNGGYMFQFENNTSTFQWVSTTGYVTMLPLRGQCMESPRLPPVPNPEHCPFVELQTKTGSWVVLIKPGYKAMFVIDTETCPPDGSGCKTTIQAIPYSMEVEPRPARNRRKVRTFEFPRSPKGWRWFL